jgi:hypothetical protein
MKMSHSFTPEEITTTKQSNVPIPTAITQGLTGENASLLDLGKPKTAHAMKTSGETAHQMYIRTARI